MLKDLIDRHELCVLSLQSQASGPTHTYCSGPHSTTVDYIICNQSATFICSSASTLDDHALNTSDHLPLKVVVDNVVLQDVEQNGPGKKINWTKAESDGSLSADTQNISSLISPLIGRDYTSIDELDTEISNTCLAIVSTAHSTLPFFQPGKSNKRRFKDPLLKELCNESKKCWRKWVDGDRLTQGSLYERMKDSKKQISARINQLQGSAERRHLQKIDTLFKEQASN